MNPNVWVVIPAAGAGLRMGSLLPKQYMPVLGQSVLEHSLAHFINRSDIAGVVVSLAEDDPYWPELHFPGKEALYQVIGGSDRAISVRNALRLLESMAKPNDWVLVHDAARPCLRDSDLDSLISSLYTDPVGGVLAVPVRDTIKRVKGNEIEQTLDREELWQAQTPQMFRLGILMAALDLAFSAGHHVTDEASAMELAGWRPRIVAGHSDNLKITHPEDVPLAEFLLACEPKKR